MGQVIAIDGPAGAGKSTIARSLAEQLGYTYIDTGAMYRSVALAAIRGNIPFDDESRLGNLSQGVAIEFVPVRRVLLNGEDVTVAIRSQDVTAGASRVAQVGRVRSAMVMKQRGIAETSNVVMEGRDIGTVVFPLAEVKIFLDADPSERARRRSADMPGVPLADLTEQMRERDDRDRRRVESPLIQAPDAVYLDSTGRTPAETAAIVLEIVRQRMSREGTKSAHAQS